MSSRCRSHSYDLEILKDEIEFAPSDVGPEPRAEEDEPQFLLLPLARSRTCLAPR